MATSMAVLAPPAQAPLHDPAAKARLGLALAALVVLWPLLVLAEFKPWLLFEPGHLSVMLGFVAGFFPPALSPDFLALLGKATLETLAIATAGITLAFCIAAPLGVLAARSLATSRIGPGPGQAADTAVRTLVRGVLAFLRAIPEVVWALVFVRVFGLGPGAGVLALAVTYGGMLGKVYAEILESGDTRPARALLESGASRRWATGCCRGPHKSWRHTRCTAGNARCARRW